MCIYLKFIRINGKDILFYFKYGRESHFSLLIFIDALSYLFLDTLRYDDLHKWMKILKINGLVFI